MGCAVRRFDPAVLHRNLGCGPVLGADSDVLPGVADPADGRADADAAERLRDGVGGRRHLRRAGDDDAGETIKIAGDAPNLGNWNTSAAVALDASQYTSGSPLWSVTITLEAGEVVEYKYVNVQPDGTVDWEADPNHTYTVPQSCATTATQSDTWQF